MADERKSGSSKPDLSRTTIRSAEDSVERRVNTERDIADLQRQITDGKEIHNRDVDAIRSRLDFAFVAAKEAQEAVTRVQYVCGAFVAFIGGMGVVVGLIKLLTGGEP